MKKVGIITQARMTSTRLPGKILKEVCGKTLLKYHIERLKKTNFEIIIATTTNATDNKIVEFAVNEGIHFYRGNEDNVLSRFYETAKQFKLDTIVRVTSDCPLIDAGLILAGVDKFIELNNENLYISNCFPRTFARGFDFEIFSKAALTHSYKNAQDIGDLEHVTPFIHQNKSGKTIFFNISQPNNNSHLRVTVDTFEDFELVKQLIENYNAHNLSYIEIEKILNSNPELININAHIEQKKL
jgi:spore coat polysaccharide biosynthesis protein SpsF